jgi:hypothetical protein
MSSRATPSGGLGLSAENTRHFLCLLINSGLAEKPPATPRRRARSAL